jgi:hypothetical protein
MKIARLLVVCSAAAAIPASAQTWEFGGGVGGGFYTSQNISSPGGSASAKIGSNVAGSVWLDNNGHGRWGGELRWDYQRGALQLRQAGTQASFGAESHALHYDFLFHFKEVGAPVRPFVAVGGGVKVFRGTGEEVVFQPLSNIALLSRTQDLVAMASVGAGFKVNLSPRVQLRLEVHDFLSPFPKQVIVPNVGSNVGGWIHDIVPMVGIAITNRGE